MRRTNSLLLLSLVCFFLFPASLFSTELGEATQVFERWKEIFKTIGDTSSFNKIVAFQDYIARLVGDLYPGKSIDQVGKVIVRECPPLGNTMRFEIHPSLRETAKATAPAAAGAAATSQAVARSVAARAGTLLASSAVLKGAAVVGVTVAGAYVGVWLGESAPGQAVSSAAYECLKNYQWIDVPKDVEPTPEKPSAPAAKTAWEIAVKGAELKLSEEQQQILEKEGEEKLRDSLSEEQKRAYALAVGISTVLMGGKWNPEVAPELQGMPYDFVFGKLEASSKEAQNKVREAKQKVQEAEKRGEVEQDPNVIGLLGPGGLATSFYFGSGEDPSTVAEKANKLDSQVVKIGDGNIKELVLQGTNIGTLSPDKVCQ